MPDELVESYAAQIEPLLPLARRAYGSRDTISPQHDASREYTRLLVEFYNAGGSLLQLAARLDVTYAGMRRRITTANLTPMDGTSGQAHSEEEYEEALELISQAKRSSTSDYHNCLRDHHERGFSLSRIAKLLGLSSANPLYFGVQRSQMQNKKDQT